MLNKQSTLIALSSLLLGAGLMYAILNLTSASAVSLSDSEPTSLLNAHQANEMLLQEMGYPRGGRFENLYGCPAPCDYVNDWDTDPNDDWSPLKWMGQRSKLHSEARAWIDTWEAVYLGDGWWLIDTQAAGNWILSETERRILGCDFFTVPQLDAAWGQFYPAEKHLCLGDLESARKVSA